MPLKWFDELTISGNLSFNRFAPFNRSAFQSFQKFQRFQTVNRFVL
jgi:hypothetical protein